MSSNFREFINDLEDEGELHRVKEEVDPELEITEIAIRAQKENKPALLFENVKGSKRERFDSIAGTRGKIFLTSDRWSKNCACKKSDSVTSRREENELS